MFRLFCEYEMSVCDGREIEDVVGVHFPWRGAENPAILRNSTSTTCNVEPTTELQMKDCRCPVTSRNEKNSLERWICVVPRCDGPPSSTPTRLFPSAQATGLPIATYLQNLAASSSSNRSLSERFHWTRFFRIPAIMLSFLPKRLCSAH